MRLGFVPVAVSVVSLVGVHVCYLLAAGRGEVPWCIPYLDSCTSISAVGRSGPESHVFRATVIPAAALALVYWALVRQWVEALGARSVALNHAMLACGMIGALGLIAYAAVLGEIGEAYRLQRRLGVSLFFGLTVIAQFLMVAQPLAAPGGRAPAIPPRLCGALLFLPSVSLLLGVVSLGFWAFSDYHARVDDAFAWWVMLLVLAQPLVTALAWRESGFEARFTLR